MDRSLSEHRRPRSNHARTDRKPRSHDAHQMNDSSAHLCTVWRSIGGFLLEYASDSLDEERFCITVWRWLLSHGVASPASRRSTRASWPAWCCVWRAV